MAHSLLKSALAVLLLSSGLYMPALSAAPIAGSPDNSNSSVVHEFNSVRVSDARVIRRGNVAVVGRGPVRRWVRRPHFGAVVGGVVLGTVIVVDTAGTAPGAPAPNMCWFWTDTSYTQGYWDYCAPPP
jgi:hypothetical protein